ncbi:MAG: 2-phospho-L-lactate transferase [Candidatus Acidiferrales bacterium]
MKITALAGGVGASKLLLGLYRVMDPEMLTAIVNTGDDIVLHGLYISPDVDIVTYTLADVVNPEAGWGIRGDTFCALSQLSAYGQPEWFHLGDRDLATHIYRTAAMREGATLSRTALSVRKALGVLAEILPMSDQPVRTMIETTSGRLNFQEYLVKLRAEPTVRAIGFDGAEMAQAAPGVLEAIAEARGVVICPSNPLISIGPVLAVPGIRDALRRRRRDVVAVCPIVAGKSLKGPSDKMLAQLGLEASARGVAALYRDFCGTFVLDSADAEQRSAIEALGINVVIAPTVMRGIEDKERLAREVLRLLAYPSRAVSQ